MRALYGVVSLFFLSLVTFLIDEVAPGDAAMVRMGDKNFTQERYERIKHEMGLDRHWTIRYGEYVGNAVQGDFGESYYGTREPVSEILGSALPMTLRLAVPAIILASFFGIIFGTIAAIKENRPADSGILALSTFGVTIPNFVMAPIMVYIFAHQLDKLPTSWEVPLRGPMAFYLVMPVIIMAARPMATLTRLTRASMIETLQMEFIKLARAKGVPPWRLYMVHGLRNAILPVITAIGTSFGFLLTGSFIVETYYIMPGMGFEAINAIQKGDAPVIMACVMMIGTIFIIVNTVVDLIQPMIDPRIREAQV
jgi:peptide/nickel transport system permease protein